MIRSLIKLGIFLVIGILCYNYFLGTPEEKASSKKIFKEIGDVGKSVAGMLRSEKSKLDEGKYDDVLDDIGGIFDNLREKVGNSAELKEKLERLESKRKELMKTLEEEKAEPGQPDKAKSKEMKKELEDLVDDTEDLAEEIEKEQ